MEDATYLLGVISKIRCVTGLGETPMLDELAGAIEESFKEQYIQGLVSAGYSITKSLESDPALDSVSCKRLQDAVMETVKNYKSRFAKPKSQEAK